MKYCKNIVVLLSLYFKTNFIIVKLKVKLDNAIGQELLFLLLISAFDEEQNGTGNRNTFLQAYFLETKLHLLLNQILFFSCFYFSRRKCLIS